MKTLAIALVRAYQMLASPLLGRYCRFEPTCSQYMIDAIRARGLFKGILLGVWRVLRCNPFGRGGHDPIR